MGRSPAMLRRPARSPAAAGPGLVARRPDRRAAALGPSRCLFMGAGLGLRDPWPADEPRFALVAQDMLRSGDWLIPRVGGDLYADKPPLFFWLMAAAMAATGSLSVGFLLPSLLAGVGTVLLVYDLLRRARGREIALAGAFVLLLTFQFIWQARRPRSTACCASSDAEPVRPAAPPAARAGAGLVPGRVGGGGSRRHHQGRGFPAAARAGTVRRARPSRLAGGGRRHRRPWLAGLAVDAGRHRRVVRADDARTAAGGDLLAYRNEILFHQTVTRYADAWHHHEPPWYYLTNVIPVLWLPLVALVPWLWPRWREALRGRDTLVAVLLAWVLIVVAVLHLRVRASADLYVLPAVPALAMAAAPWLPRTAAGARAATRSPSARLRGRARAALAAGYFRAVRPAGGADVADLRHAARAASAVSRPQAACRSPCCAHATAWLAYAGVIGRTAIHRRLVIYPRIDAVRSGRAFMRRVERRAPASASSPRERQGAVLAAVAPPERQFRACALARERAGEAADAAAWLAEDPGRGSRGCAALARSCASRAAHAVDLGRANRALVSASAARRMRTARRRRSLARHPLLRSARCGLNTGS